MDTKLKADIAESAVTTELLRLRKDRYKIDDFDFAILYLDKGNIFYIMPISVFNEYKSTISLVEEKKRQRKPKSSNYRDRWDLLSK